LEVLLSQQEVFYAVQYCFSVVVPHAVGRHSHLATQQKLGLLPQRWLRLGAADYFVTDVHRPHVMDDLIRRSAANLLAISMALAADIDDVHEDGVALVCEPSADPAPSSQPTDQEVLKVE